MAKHLGGGTVLFENAIHVPQETIIPYLENLKDVWRKENFTIVTDEHGNDLYAVNKGGFKYGIEEMTKAPVRIQNMDHPFFLECERAIYQACLEYIDFFPAILQSIWWRSGGHVLCYDKGASLGFHADNDVNYRYGSEPQLQHATRNVISVLIYLNDCVDDGDIGKYEFSGGHMEIPYFGIDIKPQKGSIVVMPANYLGAHKINEVTSGSRYSYLGWFAQGSADTERGINPVIPSKDIGPGGQWWETSVIEDYAKFIQTKYGQNIPEDRLAYTSRQYDHN
jgi:predicted 2-oxoglutarate/Fe(II)-dependent dioxygenase YbiX